MYNFDTLKIILLVKLVAILRWKDELGLNGGRVYKRRDACRPLCVIVTRL